MSVADCSAFLDGMLLDARQAAIAGRVLKEVQARLGFLLDVGLDYLSLDRPAATLSGGEAQRIRLATQIGSGLVGVLYVLDEPSIGLHQRDNHRLIQTLTRLRDLGYGIEHVTGDGGGYRLTAGRAMPPLVMDDEEATATAIALRRSLLAPTPLAEDGTLLANRGDTGGAAVSLNELPPYLPKAFVAIEDRRFYSHMGIDPFGILRAVVRDVTGHRGTQGG